MLKCRRSEGGKRLEKLYSDTTHDIPLITVVSVVYNGIDGLRDTIESVLRQKRIDLEYIVIDGESTDGTVNLLHEFNEHLDYWISEPDAGIYDAMNKAIRVARGQYIYHLNIGDRLLCIPQLLSEPISNDVICIACAVQISATSLHRPSAGIALRFHNTLHHQGCFYRRTLDLKYDLRYKIFSDFDLNQRLLLSGQKIVLCSEVVAVHGAGGISHTTRRFFEVYRIVRRNFGLGWLVVCFAYFKYRGLLKRIRLL